MNWIYLSPHFDDVALSCGGLVWEQTQAGQPVEVWTVCAGSPPPGPLSSFAESLHTRWKTGPETVVERRREDLAACARLGAQARHFTVPDCIYRRDPASGEALYPSEESLFGPLHPAETDLIRALAGDLGAYLPSEAALVCPLTLGNHVDHQLTLAVAQAWGQRLYYYADYPYRLHEPQRLEHLAAQGWQALRQPVSAAGLEAWQDAVALHASQVSSFWPDEAAMRAAIAEYAALAGGVELWLPSDEGRRI